VQILGYSDDLDIVGRSLPAIKEAFLSMERAGRKMRLIVSEAKTKYMAAGKASAPSMPSPITAGKYTFERVDSFKYLESTATHNNDISEEIRTRLMTANRAYISLIITKIRIYETLVRPVLTYGSETWILTKNDTRVMDGFERKILRRIIGPVNENGRWRRYNKELYYIYKEQMVTDIVRSARLRRAGHVVRMNKNEPPYI
jgi:hypothetical protein